MTRADGPERKTTGTDDYDSPWKELLEAYFREFTEFFFPRVAGDTDWDRGHEFLDKEFQQAVRDAELGRRYADKLVRLWRKDGGEAWVLAHVEVQGRHETEFPERMFVYNYRIFDCHRRPVASFAVLADERPGWRPDRYGYALWGCDMGIRFPVAKLDDWRGRWEALETNDNPFATAVMAHLKTQETRHDDEDRKRWKFRIVRSLYEKGYGREDVLNLFRFVDWMMRLPREMEEDFREEIFRYEEEKKMRHVTSIERIGFEKGVRQGLMEASEAWLSVKFGSEGLKLLPMIRKIEDSDRLHRIKEMIRTADELSEIREQLRLNGEQ